MGKRKSKEQSNQSTTTVPNRTQQISVRKYPKSLAIITFSLIALDFATGTFWDLDAYYNWTGIHKGDFLLGSLYVILHSSAAIPVLLAWPTFKRLLRSSDEEKPKLMLKVLRTLLLSTSLAVFVFFSMLFYGLGLVQKLSQYIIAKAPAIGSTLGAVISTIVGWMVSGVIGNFVYDILKKKYQDKFMTSKD